ncbi:MAG TPA: hypothetical protein VFM38_00455 [Candidatus Limnocylindrales bacterium]|nr:hypothetical protein [Candidatus Limnocylindrales bacterium]
MSYLSLLTHPLVIVGPATATGDPEDADDLDEYGQPTMGTASEVHVRGLVQPKSGREMALVSQAGAELSDHTIFLPSMRLSGASYITDDPPNGRRFDIVLVRSHEYGSAPHIEVDAKLVGSTEGPSVPGS